MDNGNLVAPSSFCWNPACSEYGKVHAGTIRKFGRTPAGTQRYQCKMCRQTFVEPIGTVFYGRHRSQETLLECLALLADRSAGCCNNIAESHVKITDSGSSRSVKNRSTALFVAILGTVIGVSGAIHGIHSILKGNTPTGGMLLPSIGAFTIVQNYLLTGMLAVGLGMAVVVWTIGFIDRNYGPAVFLALSVALFFVGGGIAEVAFILLTVLLSTRIHHPLGWWQRAAESRFGLALSKLWPYAITLAFSVFLIGYSIWLFILPPGEVRQIGTLHYVTWVSLSIGFILLVLVVPCGFIRDIQQRAKRDILN